MAFVSRSQVLEDMESDPDQPSPPINRYVARQSRLWMPGSSEAVNVQPPGRRLSTTRRASKSTRANPFDPALDKGELKQKPPVLERRQTVHQGGIRRLPATSYPAPPDDKTLLGLCDKCRRSLHEDKSLGPRRNELIKVLRTAVKSECDGAPTLTFNTINVARLDKLLADILDVENHPSPLPVQFRADIQIAESLQRQWRARFRDSYFGLEHERYVNLTAPGGRLENMVFKDDDTPRKDFWEAKRSSEKLSECEGNDEFAPGYWWLNIACAHRDGILCSSRDVLSKGEYDIPALPLLVGFEFVQWPGAQVKYIKESETMIDMCIPLLTLVGNKIRVLRGHLLQSAFAPETGVRYDGQYILRQYGQKRIDHLGVFRLTLILERVEGQSPMHELTAIPQPSQVDEWRLYEKHEGEMIRSRFGEGRFLEWKMHKAQETMDREQAERMADFEGMNCIGQWIVQRKELGKDIRDMDKVRRLSDLKWDR